ncbi:MAG: phosphoenolpyruvate carboxykinase, partial [Bacteroidota bacterium]
MSQLLDLGSLGLTELKRVYWNLSAPALYEEALKREEGVLAAHGPLVVRTGTHTGRSPNDKFTVKETSSADSIWWGKVNIPFDENRFENLYRRMQTYFQGKDVFVQDVFAGADSAYRIPIRVVTEKAWHNLFAQNLFIRETLEKPHEAPFTIISAPGFQAIPEQDGTNSETFIIVNFARRLVLIGGTRYAGEIKKSVFFLLNYLLPKQNVMSMHCSANIGKDDDVAVFFGLSGTGKTTLSADPERRLIGDDEHGWSEHGIFNFEGGCYAKTIRLSKEAEPEIHATTEKFGTVLENVGYDEDTRILDLDDDTLTENTRAGYPLTHLTNIEPSGLGGHPKHIVMLTADAFGVLPPISKLSPEQAMYHFLSGYTAKVAGTERGIKEPQATFSTCFGAPFMALHPTVYAKMLGEKIAKHQTECWLVNTGWIGGPYGTGNRIKIAYTRALLRAALNGSLSNVPFETDPIFGLSVPTRCDGVPAEILNPRNTWTDKKAYDEMANQLAKRFHANIDQFAGQVPEDILSAGPRGAA